jgi:hypothetical protein
MGAWRASKIQIRGKDPWRKFLPVDRWIGMWRVDVELGPSKERICCLECPNLHILFVIAYHFRLATSNFGSSFLIGNLQSWLLLSHWQPPVLAPPFSLATSISDSSISDSSISDSSISDSSISDWRSTPFQRGSRKNSETTYCRQNAKVYFLRSYSRSGIKGAMPT